jgi:hypothetical protein
MVAVELGSIVCGRLNSQRRENFPSVPGTLPYSLTSTNGQTTGVEQLYAIAFPRLAD